MGHEVTVVPFLGRPIKSLWWQTGNNPSRRLSKIVYSRGREFSKSPWVKSLYANHYGSLIRIPQLVISRNWKQGIDQLVAKNGKPDVVVFFSVPLNLLDNVPSHLREKWDLSSVYYEADMPEILPSYGGLKFSYYLGADISQFHGFLSNSEGVKESIVAMGGKRIGTLHWAVDPRLYAPTEAKKATDIFFAGGSNKFRQDWLRKMIESPAKELPQRIFATSGRGEERFEQVKRLGFLEFGHWKRQICQSKICLNISRSPHATVPGTSTTRVFELASMGACIVSNPHNGMERWFLPGKEITIVGEDENPAEIYEWLLESPTKMLEMGKRARERVVAQHTYEHRATELLDYMKGVGLS